MSQTKVKALSKKVEKDESEEWVLTRQYSRVVPKQEFSKKLEKDVNNFVKRIDKMIEKKVNKLSKTDKNQLINILDHQNVPHKLLVEDESEDEDSDKENETLES